jgi:hypothetical protein
MTKRTCGNDELSYFKLFTKQDMYIRGIMMVKRMNYEGHLFQYSLVLLLFL